MKSNHINVSTAAELFRSIGRGWRRSVPLVVAASLVFTAVVWAADSRTVLKPGWNMFSTAQDIELGQQVAPDAEKQLRMLKNARVDNYVNALGVRLAAKAPGEKYPYKFKVVDDRAINAFALPGGPVYVNRGVLESADNESQLAGVIAHEISHIALRHGTNQATKASAAQLPLAILGGLLGSDSTKGQIAQLGAGFALNSVLLKYSRTAESEADVMGTQILYDTGYDPSAMGQFFAKLESQEKGGGGVAFFSNHPSPDNRIERVNQEVTALGGSQRAVTTNAKAFTDTTRYVRTLPAPKGQPQQVAVSTSTARSAGLQIILATYGADNRFIDVRERLQSRVQNDRLDLQVTNTSMGGNPVGQAKTLEVQYRWNNRTYDATVGENQRLSIPTAQQTNNNNGINNGNSNGNGTNSSPDSPSTRFVAVDNAVLRMNHPDNWQVHGQGDAMTIAPRGGLVDDGQGNQALVYGVIVNVFAPRVDNYSSGLQGSGRGQRSGQDSGTRLEQSTDQLVQDLRVSNRNMRVTRDRESATVDGDRALSTYLSNDAPTGGAETDWLVTVEHPEGLLFVVFTAPEREFQAYEGTFREMLRSIRIKR